MYLEFKHVKLIGYKSIDVVRGSDYMVKTYILFWILHATNCQFHNSFYYPVLIGSVIHCKWVRSEHVAQLLLRFLYSHGVQGGKLKVVKVYVLQILPAKDIKTVHDEAVERDFNPVGKSIEEYAPLRHPKAC